MKILITIPCLLTGGTEFQTLNLVRVLKSANHTVIVCCYYEYVDKMVDLFALNGAEVVLFSNQNEQRPSGFWQIPYLFKNFKKIISVYRPEVVHLQYMTPGALPIFILKLLGVKKIIATVHQPYTKNHGQLAKILVQTSAKLCSKFIVVSKNAEKSWFGSSALFNEEIPVGKQPKHVTIYNAVDISKIQEIAKSVHILNEKQKEGIPENKFVFGAISRLSYEKGIDLLIEAFNKLNREYPNIHLHLVGNGSDEKKIKTLIRNFGIKHLVTFFGEADWEIAMQQMALMDVLVVPSRFEGFGLTAAEAMAMGKPVIASDSFGLKEVVEHKKTGLLFKCGDFNDLSFMMKDILLDKRTFNFFKSNSKLQAGKFDFQNFETKTFKLYDSL